MSRVDNRVRRAPRACLMALGCLVGCGTPAQRSPGPAGETSAADPAGDGTTGASVDEAEARSSRPRGDLRSRARAALVDGTLPDDVRAELLRTQEPGFATARRVFGVGEGPAPTIPSGPSNGPTPEPTPTPTPTSGAAGAVAVTPPGTASPTSTVAPPNPETRGTQGTQGTQGTPPVPLTPPADGVQAGGIAPTTAAPPAAGQGRLVMMTGMRMRKGAVGPVLEIKSSAMPNISQMSQASRGRIIYMVADAGVLPSVREGRPAMDGVRVVEVRRGETTVQISVEMDEGYEVRPPRPSATGATIEFRKTAAPSP